MILDVKLMLKLEGFNLILCYYALGEPDRMKKAFLKLVSLPLPSLDPDEQENLTSEDHDVKIMKDDQLKSMSQKRLDSHV